METLHFPPPFRAQVSELQQSINIFLAAMFCHTLSPRLTVVVGQTSSTDLGSRGEIGGLTELFHLVVARRKGLGEPRDHLKSCATEIDALHASPTRRPPA
jgi:hypothetical protein